MPRQRKKRLDFKDYQTTLGVDRAATAEIIKKAIRKVAHRYHPKRAQ